MNKLNNVHKKMQIISAAVALILTQEAAKWVQVQLREPNWISVLLTVSLAFAAAFQAINISMIAIFSNWRRVRKVLLGRQYVEGTWVDRAKDKAGNLVTIGTMRIEFSDFSLRFSGEDYDIEGRKTGHYRADMLVIEWPIIKYKYTYWRSDSGRSKIGYGELMFTETDRAPKRYSGFYIDLFTGEKEIYEGFRVEDEQTLKGLLSPKARVAVIREFFGLLDKELEEFPKSHPSKVSAEEFSTDTA